MNEQRSIQLGSIEQGVPIPDKDLALAPARDQVLLLNPGESFEFRVQPTTDPKGRAYKDHGGQLYSRNAFIRLQGWARNRGVKLTARWLVTDWDGVNVARVWRV